MRIVTILGMMSGPSLKVVPFLSTPWQIAISLFRKEDAGYRFLESRLLNIEESKPAIKRDSEGLAVIDNERITEIIKKVGFDDVDESRYVRLGSLYTEQDLEALGLKRATLKEWKDFEEWYYSRSSTMT
jgi:hypothetical protein